MNSSDQKGPTPLTYPTLKPGVNLLRGGGENREIYVGLLYRGIEISTPNPELTSLIISLLDGRRTISEIAEIAKEHFNVGVEDAGIENADSGTKLEAIDFMEDCQEVVALLAGANLLELSSTSSKSQTTSATRTGTSSGATSGNKGAPLTAQSEINFQKRIRPELNLAAWQQLHKLDSLGLVKSRANFKVEIHGTNRLAITLFTLLQASGFTKALLVTESKPTKEITVEMICGLALRNSDLGAAPLDIYEELRRSAQLIHLPNFNSKSDASPANFAISTIGLSPTQIQRWMSEGVAHLGIGTLIESKFQIGPIVIPGRTPCLRCLELWRSSVNSRHQKLDLLSAISKPLEIPASAVAALAGIIVLQICEFVATQNSPLLGASANIDLLHPLTPDFDYWKPNPECGCIT